jgi:hypothetical protein
MAETFVTVERRPDNVALIRLDRPKANALSGAVLAQLHAIAGSLQNDPPGAVVLWGGEFLLPAPTSSSSVTAAREPSAPASPTPSVPWLRSRGQPSPPSTGTPWVAGSSWHSPATFVSARRIPVSGCPRSCSA